MKKIATFLLVITAFVLVPIACNNASAQKNKAPTTQQRINEAFAHLRRSQDSTKMLITEVKSLARQKVIYRTKLVLRTDTVWRIDTCITYISSIDSMNIALIFKNRVPRKQTKVGKIIRYIFHPKTKTLVPVDSAANR